MNLIITSPEQRCKHCLGTIWFKSSTSQRLIKCPNCRGTGLNLQVENKDVCKEEILSQEKKPLYLNKQWWENFFNLFKYYLNQRGKN